MNPLRFLLELDVVFMLITNAIAFGVFTAIQATMSLIFQRNYPFLTDAYIGLCYLPMGLGMMIGSGATGRILDRVYKRDRASWEQLRGVGDEGEKKQVDKEELDLEFPIERTRLKTAMVATMVFGVCSLCFGWMVDRKVQLAGPLVFQFFSELLGGVLGMCQLYLPSCCRRVFLHGPDELHPNPSHRQLPQAGIFHNSHGTQLQPLLPPRPNVIVGAQINLFRCLLAAALTSVINPILNALGIGWTFTLLGGLFLVFSPILLVSIVRIGPKWRRKRFEKNLR